MLPDPDGPVGGVCQSLVRMRKRFRADVWPCQGVGPWPGTSPACPAYSLSIGWTGWTGPAGPVTARSGIGWTGLDRSGWTGSIGWTGLVRTAGATPCQKTGAGAVHAAPVLQTPEGVNGMGSSGTDHGAPAQVVYKSSPTMAQARRDAAHVLLWLRVAAAHDGLAPATPPRRALKPPTAGRTLKEPAARGAAHTRRSMPHVIDRDTIPAPRRGLLTGLSCDTEPYVAWED